MKGIKSLKTVFTYILDTIAPPDLAVRAVENMTVEEFIQSTVDKAKNPKPIEGVIHLFPYRTESETVRTALVTIKTYYNPRLVKLIAEATYQMLLKKLPEKFFINSENTRFILIPVPMTRKSIRARGWNQCELICKEIARFDAASSQPIFEYRDDIIMKVRETADQVGHGRAGRFENLRDSCAVHTEKADILHNRDVIVLDDIVTTGSTLSEARRALLSAGARGVICVAVAH